MPDESIFTTALAQGDHRAAGTWLVRTYAEDVLALCRAMVRDATWAEDLTQDVFGKALGALASFRGDASARTWLRTIARNTCLDALKRESRRPWDLEDEETPAEAVDPRPIPQELLSQHAAVARALAALDEASRALVVLRFQHDLGYPELAEAFGIKEGTARMRISRALARMREALAPVPLAGAAPAPRAAPMPPPAAAPPAPGAPAPGAPAPASIPASGGAPPPPPAPMRPSAPLPAPGGFGGARGGARGGGGPRRRMAASPLVPPRDLGDALARQSPRPSSQLLRHLERLAAAC